MTKPLTRKTLPEGCICGHPKAYHGDRDPRTDTHDNLGACTNARCECTTYIELCPLCQHRQPHHNGAMGECTVIKNWATGGHLPCGCKHYG